MSSIFDFLNYKIYLQAVESIRSPFQKGFRSRLAEALNCQNAYISQILNSNANFSLEQGLRVAVFLKLNEIETRYFILLIELNRAGTNELKTFFKKDLELLREKYRNIKTRVPIAKELSYEDQSIYYSSWLYPTIHMMTTIAEFKESEKISIALGASIELVHDVILFLISRGICIEKNGILQPGETQIHLGKDSPFIRQHHSNWRNAALQYLATQKNNDIHYSTVSSLSFEDAEKLKLKLVNVIQEYVETIGPSKAETLFNFNLDFYQLVKK